MGGNKELFTRAEILQVIKNHLGNSEFQLQSYTIKPASENILGFLGRHMKIIAEVTCNNEHKVISYFVKTLPNEVASHLEYAEKTRAFFKEIEVYKVCFKDFEAAQKGKGLKWRPDYYYSRDNEVVVVEDLSVRGSYMYPERVLLDEDHVLVSLEAMAALHAASYVFEDKFNKGEVGTVMGIKPTPGRKYSLEEIYDYLNFETEVNEDPEHPGNIFYQTGIKALVNLVELLPGYSLEEVEKIKKALPDKLRTVFDLVKPSKKYKNILLHGDLWANNLLFCKGEDGKVNQAFIIDFQLARFAPVAHELAMFFHLCQNQEFREKRLTDMLRHYHKALDKELALHGLSTDKVGLPWDTLVESVNFYDEYGVLCTVFYFPIVILPPEVSAKMVASPEMFDQIMLVDRTEMVRDSFMKNEFYRDRISGVLNDYIKRYILA